MLTHPPYALAPTEFRFRALASLAGHATLGGARELLLATLLVARLVDGVAGLYPLSPPLRRARATAAKTWLSALALPAQTRASKATVRAAPLLARDCLSSIMRYGQATIRWSRSTDQSNAAVGGEVSSALTPARRSRGRGPYP